MLLSSPGPPPVLQTSIVNPPLALAWVAKRHLSLKEMQGRVLAPSATPATHLPNKPPPPASSGMGNFPFGSV